MKKVLNLFVDCSFSPESGIAAGASFAVEGDIEQKSSLPEVDRGIHCLVFKSKSCVEAEILNLLFVLERLSSWHDEKLTINVFTDSKAIHNLPERQRLLESRKFCSKKTGKELNLKQHYQRFFTLTKNLRIKIIWLKGHSPTSQQTFAQRIFSRIDRFSRKTLRKTVRKTIENNRNH